MFVRPEQVECLLCKGHTGGGTIKNGRVDWKDCPACQATGLNPIPWADITTNRVVGGSNPPLGAMKGESG
jgi:hypothetical protein